jgi:hypothetical protein
VHSYDDYESFDFGCSDPSSPYLEFPILWNETNPNGPYEGGDPGLDRIVIGDLDGDFPAGEVGAWFCGLITQNTQSGTGWAACENVGG